MPQVELVQHESLRAAQNAVMAEVSYVQKQDGENVPYKMITEAMVLDALRPAMVKHGIVMYPVACNPLWNSTVSAGRDGKPFMYMMATRTFRFAHVHSEHHVDVTVFCDGWHNGDKCGSVVNTVGKKNALREFFCLETGNDPEYMHVEQGSEGFGDFQMAISAIKATQTVEDCQRCRDHQLSIKQWPENHKAAIHACCNEHISFLNEQAERISRNRPAPM